MKFMLLIAGALALAVIIPSLFSTYTVYSETHALRYPFIPRFIRSSFCGSNNFICKSDFLCKALSKSYRNICYKPLRLCTSDDCAIEMDWRSFDY